MAHQDLPNPDMDATGTEENSRYTQRRSAAGAEAEYRTALVLNRKNIDAHICLGHLFADEGDVARAKAEFRTALALDPQNVGAHIRLGNLLADEGDVARAKAESWTALALDPETYQ
jgi:Tfp pilus assembly protein PilF